MSSNDGLLLRTHDAEQPPPAALPLASTQSYVIGEDSGRLADAAQYMGLRRKRRPLGNVRKAVSRMFRDNTVTSARMHSVGAIGKDERVDDAGTLHYISLRRGRSAPKSLHNLFEVEQQATAQVVGMTTIGEEEEEIEVVDMVEGGSLQAAIFGIIKGTVGPAILYLPHGFQASGYAVAIPAMIFATMMFIYNAYRLLHCWRVESDRNHQVAARMEQVRTILDSSAPSKDSLLPQVPLVKPVLLTYPELARRAFGSRYSILVDIGIASMQFGVCLTYLIFVPANLHECVLSIFGLDMPKYYLLWIMVLIQIPLSWISDIRKLTPTNVLASILISFGLFSVLALAISQSLKLDEVSNERAFWKNLSELPAVTDTSLLFIGTSFFMMEGSMTLIVPLQEAVFRTQDRARFPKINAVVTSWIVAFYIFFSLICIAGFGVGLPTALTATLKGTLGTIVQLAYSIAVIFTFPLQAYPAMEVTSKAVLGDGARRSRSQADDSVSLATVDESTKRRVLATTVTCLLGLIALVAIDYLGNVVSILGALFGIPLALVFPPLMHNILVRDSSDFTKMINYGVVVIGFFAMGAASYSTIVSWDKGAEGG